MKKSENIASLFAALAKAQSKFKGAIADSDNETFDSTYADLSSVWEAIRGPLSDNGLSVIQTTSVDASTGVMFLHSILAHSSGEWMSSDYPIMPMKENDPQALGATITYARRYALSALVGIAQVDDDAESLMGQEQRPASKSAAKAKEINDKFKASPTAKRIAVPLVRPKSVFPAT